MIYLVYIKYFGIADGILIAGFDKQDKDHNETLDKVLIYTDRQY